MKVRITDLLDSYEDESVRLSSPSAQRTDWNPNAEKETIEVKQSKHRFGWKEGLAAAAAVAVLVLGGFGLGKVLNRETTPSATEGPEVSQTIIMNPEHTDDVHWAEAAVYTLSSEERLAISRALMPTVKAEFGPASFVLAPEEISFGTKGEDPVPEKLEPGMKIGLDFTVWSTGTDAVQEDQLPELFALTREQADAMQKQDGTPVLIASGLAELTCGAEGYSVESCTTAKVRPAPETMSGEEMDPELRRTANRFLTYFAEQGVTEITGEPYDMVSFAHLYYKINEPEAITYRELDGESYETLTKEQVDNLLVHLIVTDPPTVEDPTDFTEQRGDNYAQHEMFRDGIYWFPAADGDPHTQFAVVDQATNNQDGTWKLEYRVYDLAEPGELTAEEKDALADLTVPQVEADERFEPTMRGTATVLFYTNDEPQIYLHYLDASPVSIQQKPVTLTPAERDSLNRFLTHFAEQGWTEFGVDEADEYTFVKFAHLYYKINDWTAIRYQDGFETLTLEQVNEVLGKLFGKRISPVDGTDYTAQRGGNDAQHEHFHDGLFWFPPVDGGSHTRFAVCEETCRDLGDGSRKLEFRVYDVTDLDDIADRPDYGYSGLTIAQAEELVKQGVLHPDMNGTAIAAAVQDGWQLWRYYASWVDPASLENEELEPAVQASVNSLLSRLAEQDVRNLNELKADESALMTFAYHLAKSGQFGEIPFTAQSRDGKDYLTLKLSDLNWLLQQIFLNAKASPAEGGTFSCPIASDLGAQGFVKGGVVWFPSGEDVSYPNFVVCDGGHTAPYEVTWADGTIAYADCLFVNFRVYEAGLEDYSLNADSYRKLAPAEAEALAAEKTIYLVEKGTAVILPADGGQVLQYQVSWVEPEGWEEEWPQEYPVTEYRIEGDGFLQRGEINMYRYEQLPEAEGYVDVLTGIAREALGVSDASFEMDSAHDGYANWFLSTPQGGASVSGSSITGRFCYNLAPGFDRILAASGTTITDRGAMEAAATRFVQQFEGITGPLELAYSRVEEQAYHDERFTGLRDVIVPTMTFLFRSEENSRKTVKAQEGLTVPVTCGDSTLDDLSSHVFAVQVWPDGTVVSGDNYITRAEIVADGTLELPDEGRMETILSFMTSLSENDVFVLESAGIEEYSVYFGYGTIDPVLTVRYHFASDPDEHQTTQISIPGLLD